MSASSDCLGVCLAFRNAAPYLREWLLFHRAVGFTRFYLYNNDSTDAFAGVLEPFLRADPAHGFSIEVISWPGYHQQNAIYDDCLRRARGVVDWVAFIDDDEFLYATADEPLADVLAAFPEAAGVAVNWVLYGTGGHIHADGTSVIQRFTRRAASPDHHVKVIARPERVVKAVAGGHHLEAAPGRAVVDEIGRAVTGATTPNPSATKLRLNHYIMKSVEEFIGRRTSRDIGYGDQQKLPLTEWIRLDRNWNVVEDASAQRMLPAMAEWSRRVGT